LQTEISVSNFRTTIDGQRHIIRLMMFNCSSTKIYIEIIDFLANTVERGDSVEHFKKSPKLQLIGIQEIANG
jgi:hypothetical protein